ncbi:transducin beta-like protein 2 isoform X2 [Watersipora subatra]|uniref:transducin beta-like protein 2 isoform X2 n=1 Tax=Watersipora subatra TaxID=2589382 RepID=UPI00355BDF9C
MWPVVIGIACVVIAVLGFCCNSTSKSNEVEEAGPQTEQKVAKAGDGNAQKKKKLAKCKPAAEFRHPLLLTTFKGHGGEVTSFDVSSNGKYLISTATDRSLFIWNMKELNTAGKGVKSVRGNVEYDSANLIKFSPDNKSFITSLDNANSIRVFKMSKNDDGIMGKVQAVMDFQATHTEVIMSIGIDSSGNYLMTADNGTRVDIFNLKGDILHSIDTGTMKNSSACVSPCGRFVAVSGFTPDVKVWEVSFDKVKQFKSVKRAFDLTGHNAGVLSVAFSADSSRAATVAKDMTWKLWNIDVEYEQGQDPSLLCTGKIAEKPEEAIIALSPNGKTVAIAIENNIVVYNVITQQADVSMTGIFSSEIRHVAFSVDECGKYLFCCGDRQVKVFNNVTGYRSKIDYLNKELRNCNQTAERRLNEQLQDASNALAQLEKQSSS